MCLSISLSSPLLLCFVVLFVCFVLAQVFVCATISFCTTAIAFLCVFVEIILPTIFCLQVVVTSISGFVSVLLLSSSAFWSPLSSYLPLYLLLSFCIALFPCLRILVVGFVCLDWTPALPLVFAIASLFCLWLLLWSSSWSICLSPLLVSSSWLSHFHCLSHCLTWCLCLCLCPHLCFVCICCCPGVCQSICDQLHPSLGLSHILLCPWICHFASIWIIDLVFVFVVLDLTLCVCLSPLFIILYCFSISSCVAIR